ncbi:SFT1 (YKL006C-A) [Zygosaccharomyces parabailii]|nr:SFT1 (YKL006C-A) [Zygosaccharomyces parabailii]
MSNSRYSQIENSNDQRLNSLANKLSTFREINQDIGDQAVADNSALGQLSDLFDSLLRGVRNTSHRLTRSLNAGGNVWRMVGMALLLFFIVYTLFKIF